MADFFTDLNNRLQQQAQQGQDFSWQNYRTNEKIKQLAEQRKKKQSNNGNFFTSLIPTAGGTVGSLGGAAAGAALGSVVPGVGTAVGGLLGALLGGAGGSALGKVGENAVEGEKDLSKGVGQEALFGGITSLPVGAGLKLAQAGAKVATGVGKKAAGEFVTEAAQKTIPTFAKGPQEQLLSKTTRNLQSSDPLKTSVQGRAINLGNKALSSQYGTISTPVARATNPEQTFGSLADAGITKPEDVERLTSAITGANGIVNKAVVNSVGKAGGVDTTTLRQVFQDALDNNGLNEADRKALTSTFESQMKRLTGGARGSLNPLANPSDTLGVMKSIESRIANLTGKGGNYRLTTPERTDQANVLKAVRDELQDKLYEGAGANAKLGTVLTPQLRNKLINLQPNNPQWENYVDQKIMGAQTIGDLRSAQAPFVSAGKIINDAELNGMTFSGRAGNAFSQGGVRGMIAETGANIVKNPAARASAKLLRAAGGAKSVKTPGQTVVGAATRQGLGRGLLGALGAPEQQMDQLGLAPEDYQTLSAEGYQFDPTAQQPQLANETAQQPSGFGGTDQNQVAAAMVNALQAGDIKSFSALKDLYDTIASVNETTATTGYGKPSAQQYALAQSGLSALDQLTGLIGQNPNIVNQGAVPGQDLPIVGGLISNAAGTGEYNSAARQVIDAIARARTGAAMTAQEESFYRRMLPQPGDNQDTVNSKLQALQQALQPFIPQPGQSSAPTLQDALLAGYGA